MTTEKRLDNLENLVRSLISKINNDNFYTNAETEGVRKNAATTSFVAAENESAILDEADVIDENSNAVLDIADYIAELEERVAALEGGQ